VQRNQTTAGYHQEVTIEFTKGKEKLSQKTGILKIYFGYRAKELVEVRSNSGRRGVEVRGEAQETSARLPQRKVE